MPDPTRAPWVLDLDGVVWRGTLPIAGSVDAIRTLGLRGHRVGFCTNNSSTTVGEYLAKLTGLGVEAEADDLVTSAMAVIGLVEPGQRALACAGPGVVEALRGHGVEVVDGQEPDRVDVVVVGFHRTFDYRAMTSAARAVDAGATLIATNDDPRYPTADGFSPGCGAILASIERATGVRGRIAGKPTEVMGAAIRSRFGEHGVFIGDSLDTDGAMAARLGWPFGLVLSGNTGPGGVPPDHPSEWVAGDLAQLVDRWTAPTPR